MRNIVIGVMGPGNKATKLDIERAYTLGKLIASEGWILLTGGRKQGVMNAASQGAKSANGHTIGILPTNNNDNTSDFVDIAIITGIGSARNNINVLSSNIIVACGMGAGTASEVALAIKAEKRVILLTDDEKAKIFFQGINRNLIYIADSPKEVIQLVKKLI